MGQIEREKQESEMGPGKREQLLVCSCVHLCVLFLFVYRICIGPTREKKSRISEGVQLTCVA
jgi:hypothetical protein